MALDTSIPLRALQGMYNPADTVQQAASLKDMVQQQQLRGLQIQDAMDARQRRKSLRDLYAGAVNPQTGEIDYRKVRTGYAQMGDIEGLAQVEDIIGKMDDRQRAQAKARADTLAAAAQTLRGLPYEQRRAALMQMAPTLEPLGLTAEQLQAFDPTDANIGGVVAQALGVKGLLEKEHRDRTFGETVRHNQATEALTRRGQDITVRGQNLTEAREREKMTQGGNALPKPPPGYRYTANGDLEAIPGGPAAQKEQQAAQKQQAALQAQEQKARLLIADIDDAIKDVGFWTAGMGTGKLAQLRGTGAYNLERKLDAIKANLGFQELAAMRAASPTGGALGAVSERELTYLQSTVASLDPGQSPEQLRRGLEKARQHYQNWLSTVRQARLSQGGQAPDLLRSADGGKSNPQRQALYDEFGLEE